MSEVREVVIKSEEDALALLDDALNGKISDDDTVLISFDGWPTFNLDVKGERYHSTVTSSLMKGLLEYQQVINRTFASSVYSRGAKSLSDEDRATLELTFEVNEGSSEIEAQLQESMNRLGEKMIDKMTGSQLVITVLGLALTASLYFGYENHLNHEAAVATENNRHALERRLVENNEHIADALQDANRALVAIVKSAPDAKSLSAGNAEFDRDDILQLTQRERESTEPRRIDGNYYVVSIKALPEKWRLDVVKVGSDEIIKIDLFKGQHAADGIGEILNCFLKEKPIFLHALAKVKYQKIVSASILGTKETGLPPAEDLFALRGQIEEGYNPDQE